MIKFKPFDTGKVYPIKALREITGMSLQEAKQVVDSGKYSGVAEAEVEAAMAYWHTQRETQPVPVEKFYPESEVMALRSQVEALREALDRSFKALQCWVDPASITSRERSCLSDATRELLADMQPLLVRVNELPKRS